MFLALIDRRQEHNVDGVLDALTSADGAREQFERANEAEERTWNLLWMEFILYAAREPAAGEKLAAQFRAWHAEFAQALERWLAERDVEPVMPAEDLARLLIAVGNGLGLQALADPEAKLGGIFAAAMERLLSDARGHRPFGGSP